jgi:Fe-S-cluster containining protein
MAKGRGASPTKPDLPARIPLRVLPPSAAPSRVSCLDCAQCCTYVAIEVEPPTRPRWASDILHWLDHEAVSVRCDEEGTWFIQLETRCRQLADDRKCRIYPHRPHICRSYDDASCEVNQPSQTLVYRTRAAFLEYLERERPRIHRALEAL